MQLIRITSIPIEYQLQIERPRLEVRQAQPKAANLKTSQGGFQMESRPTEIRIDTTEMRNSIGLQNVSTKIAEAAQRGMQAAQAAKAEYAQEGNQMADIAHGMTVAQMVAQKVMQQPDSMTVFLPSTGPVISWQPGSLEMQYHPTEMETDWEVMRNTMDFVPGKFQMIIKQYPRIQIEYLGEPNYVPPSAAPNYEEKA